jgi:hypothetical protein
LGAAIGKSSGANGGNGFSLLRPESWMGQIACVVCFFVDVNLKLFTFIESS